MVLVGSSLDSLKIQLVEITPINPKSVVEVNVKRFHQTQTVKIQRKRKKGIVQASRISRKRSLESKLKIRKTAKTQKKLNTKSFQTKYLSQKQVATQLLVTNLMHFRRNPKKLKWMKNKNLRRGWSHYIKWKYNPKRDKKKCALMTSKLERGLAKAGLAMSLLSSKSN